MKPLLIIGASPFGRLISALAEDAGRHVAGFLDDFNEGDGVVGHTRDLGARLSATEIELAMAIGYKHLDARLAMFHRLRAIGFDFPALVHPSARVSSRASLGQGCIVMANADIDAFTRIGDICVVWPNATISHDNTIGASTFISPAATLCGFVSIGDLSFIGANSTLVDGSVLPARSFVKAASRHNSRPLNA